MGNGNRDQQAQVSLPSKAAPTAPTVPEGMTVAWFTERELVELRKVVRDADGELGARFLKLGIERARVAR